jgi:hypothetical protein
MRTTQHQLILATGELDRDRATLARLLAEVDCPITVTAPAGRNVFRTSA